MSVLAELQIQKTDFKYYYPTNDLVTGPDILFSS
jgi:valyl-tRNA synthetase